MHLIILNKFSRIIKEKQNEMKRGKKNWNIFLPWAFLCVSSRMARRPRFAVLLNVCFVIIIFLHQF